MRLHQKSAVPFPPNVVVEAQRPNYNRVMVRRQAFRFELMPTNGRRRDMRRFAGSCRFVYNKALALQKARVEAGEKKLGYAVLCRLLTEWRNGTETLWLKEAPTHPLQQALLDLERAYRNFFEKRANFPRFKKKGRHDSFRYPDPKQIKLDQVNSRIFLPKLGWLRYRNSRAVLGHVMQVTVSDSGGKWFISIQTEREVGHLVHPSGSMVGLDVGVTNFATLSDGIVYAPVGSYRKHEKRLVFLQRQMSRKQKFSANWKKAKARVQKLHSKIANIRRDHVHKTSHAISQNHAIVMMEDLQIRHMSRSAAGTTERPGWNVRAKSGLNKSILDQGWFEFRRQLEYKQAWRGGWVIAVPPQNTSRTCPACGCVSAQNRKTRAQFECVACGYSENADVNAARNILAAGHAVLAHGESVPSGRSVKWEPAEATWAEMA